MFSCTALSSIVLISVPRHSVVYCCAIAPLCAARQDDDARLPLPPDVEESLA